ncbi:MAG TPA: PhnD/SsuA/transferrin family substrate-binding protein [Pseudoflavonifractor sp.]|nr:PhnD/SsuA/transferrin family substrate-binding protein [Pseudoflavonifractor sp.]
MYKNRVLKTVTAGLLTAVMALGMAGCGDANSTQPSASAPTGGSTPTTSTTPAASPETKNTSPITMVWYPNESATDYQPARDEFARIITEATGRQVEHKLTTDYAIAIEALASGSADICFMGAAGYIEAKNKNPQVDTLFVNSGASGTLDDAIYYSWLAVNKGQEDNYKDGDKYSIANIQGKKMSFVSNSSTSGFKVPTTDILAYFGKIEAWKDITIDDLVEGGSNAFFSEVLFGGSHQGSAFNLLSGKSELAAFCDTELATYADLKEGEVAKTGAVYAIKDDATAPFDTVRGKEFVVIHSTPVLNGPFAYNPGNFSDKEIQAIRDAFLSDEVANNTQLFVDSAAKDAGVVGMFKKTDKEHFVLVDDAWYNPIREMN